MLDFSQIPGLESVKNSLVQAVIDNRIPQTQLFLNYDGGAGLSLALAFSKYIACSHPTMSSCGVCNSCRQFETDNYADLVIVFPFIKERSSKKDKSRSLDYLIEFRALLKMNPFFTTSEWHNTIESGNKQFSIPVSEAEYIVQALSNKTVSNKPRFIILWLPEALTTEAANKLLKTLEEPGPGNYFFLVSNNPEKILPTIVSRCISVRIPKHRTIDVLEFLMVRGINESQATTMALASDGNLGKSLASLIQGSVLNENTEGCIQWLRLLYSRKIEGLVNWCDTLSRLNRVELIKFLSFCTHVIQMSIALSIGTTSSSLTQGSFNLKSFVPYLKTEKGAEIVALFDKAVRDVERNGSPKIILLDLSFSLLKYIG
jgi:DNA polymerase-3 subunit delta'